MAYIGRPLNAGNLAVQSGTGDGSDTTPIATLDHSVGSSNSVAVYLDGVRQLAGTDYTAVGTTLTFTTAPANGVGVDVYFLGLEVSIPTPADATVAKAKITTTLINEHVDTTITAADSILFSDATDSNANKKDTVQGILDLASGPEFSPQGRLTLTTNVPVTTSDVTSAGTVYFTPFDGRYIWLYNTTSSIWERITFSQISIALSGGTASKPHDIFCYNNSGTATLELVAWTNNTTRATALALQDNKYIKSGDASRLYLGTTYLDGSKQAEDSVTMRGLWNYYNRKNRRMVKLEATASWTYSTSTGRYVDNDAANRLDFVIGVSEEPVEVFTKITVEDSGSAHLNIEAGPVLDGVGFASLATPRIQHWNPAANKKFPIHGRYRGLPGIGFHFIAFIEYSGASGTTWHGDSHSGISGTIKG